MSLSTIESGILVLEKIVLPPVPYVQPLVFQDMGLIRKVDILKAELKYIKDDMPKLRKLYNEKKNLYTVIINGDQLWIIQPHPTIIEVDVFNAYTFEHIKWLEINIFHEKNLVTINRVYETNHKSVWIECRVYGSNYFTIFEVSASSLAIVSVGFDSRTRCMLSKSDTLMNTMFSRYYSREQPTIFYPPEWEEFNAFTRFYSNDVLSDSNIGKVLSMVRKFEINPDNCMKMHIEDYLLKQEAQIIIVADHSEPKKRAWLSIYYGEKHRQVRIKDFTQGITSRIVLRGDGAIFLFSYMLDKFLIFC